MPFVPAIHRKINSFQELTRQDDALLRVLVGTLPGGFHTQ
jgi:hypothetical protein